MQTSRILKPHGIPYNMRRKFHCFSFLALLGLLFSCQFTETMHIQEDGSGTMSFSFDGSEVMQMVPDSLNVNGRKKIDSLIVFKDFLELKKTPKLLDVEVELEQ